MMTLNAFPIDFSLLDASTPLGFAAATVFKASVLLLLTGALTAMLSRGTASSRHLVWAVGIGGALALPVVSLALPWSWEVLPAPHAALAAADAVGGPAASAPSGGLGEVAGASQVSSPAGAGPFAAGEVDPAPGIAAPPERSGVGPRAARVDEGARGEEARAATPLVTTEASSPAPGRRLPLGVLLGSAWALGAALLLLHQSVGRLALFVLGRSAEPVGDPVRARIFEGLVRSSGVERPVRLLVSDRARVPMTWGLLRPVILLPGDARGWSQERLRLVLQHEIAHVRRLDALTHALGRVACSLYWFNPLAWWAAERLRSESELASDDCVLRQGERASDYAGHLLDIVTRTGRPGAPVGALPLADRSRFEGRLLAILEPARAREGVRAGTALTLSAAGAAAVVLLAAVSPAGAAEQSVEPPEAPSPPQAVEVPEAPAAWPAPLAPEPPEIGDAPFPEPFASRPRPAAAPPAPVHVPAHGPATVETPTPENAPAPPAPREARSWLAQARAAVSRFADGQELDSAAVAALVRALREDENEEVRKTAAWALGQIEDRAATPALGDALRTDASVEVRRTAAWALGQIEDPGSAAVLGEALSDADVEVRRTALWALGQIEAPEAVGPLSTALGDADPEVRKTAAWGLGQIESREAIAPLGRALSDPDPEVREQVVWALGQIEAEESVGALAGALDDESPVVRRQAAWALGQIESAAAVEGLGAALAGDTEAGVREQAAWALGQIEAAAAVPALAAALSDADERVAAQAAWAIGQIEPTDAPPELLALARSGSGRAREMALWALAQIEDPAAVPALVEAMRDGDEGVRAQALNALSRLRGEVAVEAIAALLQDPSPEVRAAAARALAGRGGGSPRPRPQPQPRPRPQPRPNGG